MSNAAVTPRRKRRSRPRRLGGTCLDQGDREAGDECEPKDERKPPVPAGLPLLLPSHGSSVHLADRAASWLKLGSAAP